MAGHAKYVSLKSNNKQIKESVTQQQFKLKLIIFHWNRQTINKDGFPTYRFVNDRNKICKNVKYYKKGDLQVEFGSLHTV